MGLFEDEPSPDMVKQRRAILSEGHQPPRFVDKAIPTLEARIYADGGPGKLSPGAQGTNPWIAGSMTIGTNRIWNIDLIDLETSTPNVWFKIRHNHSGTASPTAAAPYNAKGGTISSFHLAARGGREIKASTQESPIRSIRSGTVFIYGFGAGSVAGTSSNRVHKAIGVAATDRFSALFKGMIE